ncbi:insulin receptor substrate 1-like isoform X5 [Belonocnema kinseyi]|uniref:insulin receptor substrate 1-like isoform X5 n=1 Tax=Belonocnema kinseyi TaxID=2817044 RepID=UPI00143E0D70|nr:insulin receptor substrate 1-like isoform X5 [Belonocnema kinseyi]
MSSSRSLVSPLGGPIVLTGHLRKLKTLKKKFFVLRGEATGCPACLEYYDNKKKFENSQPPKRSISLHSCFNINKRSDTKQKHVIALYTKDECFCIVLDNEKEMADWLNAMLLLQNGGQPDGEQPRPTFEHVWQVTMQKKGLGERKNIHGPYRLCLTDAAVTFVKVGAKHKSDLIEFPLVSIRRCGFMDRIFYMEMGRSAVTGGGEFWMEAEDNNIAHNMHAAILNAMTNSNANRDEVGPRQRMRSSSANEASKPISVLPRRHTGQKLLGFSPLGTSGRERCDSLPSRARTTSEGHPTPPVLGHPRAIHLGPHAPRPHSMYGRGISYSPPVTSMPISPASGACSTDSAGSSLSMDDGVIENIMEEGLTPARYGHSLTPDEPVILEENGDDYAPWPSNQQKYSPNFKSHSPSQSSYVEMYSPCGSSPSRGGGAYMPMSPATTAHSHSRASSLVEETSTLPPDGYVPMAPAGDDGYVHMDPSNSQNGHFPDDMSTHGGSSCSVTSGTPSTDLRFSEYHLDKVTSFLAPGEDLQARQTRAYSVGARPDPATRHRKNSIFRDRFDFALQEASRVRAFSVGSRSKRPEIGRLANIVTAPLQAGVENSNANKSNSAPLLSSSWGHTSGCSTNSERMEDLMELDFTRPHMPTTVASPPSSYSQSQSVSTATDTSSYVDMSPGQQQQQPPATTTTTAPYVDMSGVNKTGSSINRNNNNNSTTANHNHNNVLQTTFIPSLKPVITTLKPVEEAEAPYMRMDPAIDYWLKPETSPKDVPSPMQDDYMQMNGPPGVTRTAPVDLPQPRRPPEGYVEMSFKVRPSLEQDYINMNMNMGANARSQRRARKSNRKDKVRSQPIAIQAGSKPTKAPSFLPLNNSPTSESLESTPATPPRATPTGSSATIFPFFLNSPQSPEKPFSAKEENSKSSSIGDVSSASSDYAVMVPSRKISAPSPLPGVDDKTLSKLADVNTPSKLVDAKSPSKVVDEQSPSPRETIRPVSNPLLPQEVVLAPLVKRTNDLSLSKPRLVTASPTASPTPPGFKPVQSKPSSPKLLDETPTPTPTPTPTSTPTPSPLDSEGYEKLQPGSAILHYASLDLPEVSGAPPVSPIPVQEGFKYAEIDFAKLKQN